MPAPIEHEIKSFLNETIFNVTDGEMSFLEKNIDLYSNINFQLRKLVVDGYLVSPPPLKLQSLREKKLIVRNFDECVTWYNEWVTKNNFGNIYSDNELDNIMIDEDQKLNSQLDQQNLLQ